MLKRFWNQELLILLFALLPLCLMSALPARNYFVLGAFVLLLTLIRNRRILDVLLLGVFGGYLYLSVSSTIQRFEIDTPFPVGHFNRMIPQILAQKVEFPERADPRTLSLPNPHPPSMRGPIPTLWDLSLYKGRYYMYWGIAPLLTVGLPYYLFTHRYLLEAPHGLVFAWGILVFGYLLGLRLIRRLARREAWPIERFLVASVLTLGCGIASVIHRIAHYEISILAATAFALGGLYWIERGREKPNFLYLGGFFIGLGISSRASAVFALFAAIGLCTEWRAWRKIVYGLIPSGMIAASYNFLRFDNPFEFGLRYVCNNVDFTNFFDRTNEVIGLGAFLLQPFFSRVDFPFIELRAFGTGWLTVRHAWMSDAVIGLFFLCPFVLLAIPAVDRWFRHRPYWPLAGLTFSAIAYLLLDAAAGINLRYSMEFVPLFALASLVWLLVRTERQKVGRALAYSLIFYSVNAGFFISWAFEFDRVEYGSPKLSKALREFYPSKTPTSFRKGTPPNYPADFLLTHDRCGAQPRSWIDSRSSKL